MMNESQQGCTIERGVRAIALWGVLLFAGLIVTLIVVQSTFERSIAKLCGRVVPIQRELGELNDAVSTMFLAQQNVLARSLPELIELETSTADQQRVEAIEKRLEHHLMEDAIHSHRDFPHSAADHLEQTLRGFLCSRAELFIVAKSYRTLRNEFEFAEREIAADLNELLGHSAAISGKLRLDYVVRLRELARSIENAQLDEQSAREIIHGESRIATEAIDSFDLAAHEMHTLAGRVSAAEDADTLNSLLANVLPQTSAQLRKSLQRIGRLVHEQHYEADVKRLVKLTERLIAHVESPNASTGLQSIRRRIIQQEAELDRIEQQAQLSASGLRRSTHTLMGFSQRFSEDVSQDSASTIGECRAASLIVSFAGLILMIGCGFRVRASIAGLRTQNQSLKELSESLTNLNAGLEHAVAERTASMQMILDSTGDGIFTVDLEGRILAERSRAIDDCLGCPLPDQRAWDYLSAGDHELARDFQLAFEQMIEDVLPFSVAASQAPERIQTDGSTYEVRYREIREGQHLGRLLIIVRDVSAEVEAERAAQAVAELQTILGNLFRDRAWFCDSMREIEQLLCDIKESDDLIVSRRMIHTLKGNSSVLGFRVFAEQVHRLEGELEVSDEVPTECQLAELDEWWQDELSKLGAFFEFCDTDLIQVRKVDFERLIERIEQGAKHSELLKVAQLWRLQPLSVPLNRLARQGDRLANQLGKRLTIEVEDNGLSLPEDRLAEFWPTMIHLMRNAVDHGLELPSQRRTAGKSERGVLRLESDVVNGWLEVRIIDDGKGIDWDQIREKAEDIGLNAVTDEDLIDALFSDGFSTKEVATELSGRGVGLAAIRQSVEHYGGGISVQSEIGCGTTFVIRFPWGHSVFCEDIALRSNFQI